MDNVVNFPSVRCNDKCTVKYMYRLGIDSKTKFHAVQIGLQHNDDEVDILTTFTGFGTEREAEAVAFGFRKALEFVGFLEEDEL